jgi:hypothetical protein
VHRPRALLSSVCVLLSLLPLLACATSHFDDVVRLAASKHPRECTTPYTVTQLNGWSFRVDACEGTHYYRCSYRRKSMGRTQCCREVADASAASAFLSPSGPAGSTCMEFAD